MMNGIDIASWQTGIDLGAVPCDFVIVKATEGTTYVNPDCNRAVQQTLNLGKKVGVYHFASGTDALAEADYFVDHTKGYIGKAMLVLDWEADATHKGVAWTKQWLDRVQNRTGIKPLIYMSNSVVNSYNWSSVANADYGLWNAGYYAYGTPMGYNPNAPLIGGTGAWGGAAIYQYTSEGQLNGWGGNLDLNVFYGDANSWDKYAGRATGADPAPAPQPTPVPKPTVGEKVNMMDQRGPSPNRLYSGVHDASVAELQQILATYAGYDRAVNGIADEALYQFMCRYTVELNDRGNVILWTQKRLDILGYNSGGADGYAEQQTMDAIARFQTAYGLGVGHLGGTDWYYMMES